VAHARAMALRLDEAYEAFWRLPDADWLRRYEPELDNTRLAISVSLQGHPALARRLVGAAAPLFLLLGLAPEARRLCAAAAPPTVGDADPPVSADAADARYWIERSRLEWGVSPAAMQAHAGRALEVARAAADVRGQYLALRCLAGAVASGAVGAGRLDDIAPGLAARALPNAMAALEQPGWDLRLRAQRSLAGAAILQASGDLDAAAASLRALLACDGIDGLGAVCGAAWTGLAVIALQAGDPAGAVRWAAPLLAARSPERGNYALLAQAAVGQAWLALGEQARARAALLAFAQGSRRRSWEWLSLHADALAWLAAAEGRVEDAARLVGHADHARGRLGPRDANASTARVQAWSCCAVALTPAGLAHAMAAGERLDEAAACAVGFGSDWDSDLPSREPPSAL